MAPTARTAANASAVPQDAAEENFFLRFWGVRGTIACPGGEYVRYGGNTSCIEIRCGKRLLILDAGTGLRPLGVHLSKNGVIDADLLLTHTHLDHVAGLPFFLPIFKQGNSIRFWAGHLAGTMGLKDVIKRMLDAPLFPVPMSALGAKIKFCDFECGDTLEPHEGIVVRTAHLNHPNGATGYRIEFAGKSICYVTDTEHTGHGLDQNILKLIKGTDIFIYDSTYTEAEYPEFKGWGHSTWEEGAKLAEAAGVRTFVIFHHAPEHNDNFMDEIADSARRRLRDSVVVAREGLILRP
ncbi:MAG: MBL fold metallo-hydrolase [Alphaproteobacteria bacterium]